MKILIQILPFHIRVRVRITDRHVRNMLPQRTHMQNNNSKYVSLKGHWVKSSPSGAWIAVYDPLEQMFNLFLKGHPHQTHAPSLQPNIRIESEFKSFLIDTAQHTLSYLLIYSLSYCCFLKLAMSQLLHTFHGCKWAYPSCDLLH